VPEGMFVRGFANGYGTGTRFDGGHYVGGWRDGMKHGAGIYAYSDGEACEVRSGKGVEPGCTTWGK
jgi:hypothetical protein